MNILVRPKLHALAAIACTATVAACDSNARDGRSNPDSNAEELRGARGTQRLSGGVIIASDTGVPDGRVLVVDPARGVVVYEYDPRNDPSGPCLLPNAECKPYGMHYVNQDGEDYLDVAILTLDRDNLAESTKAAYSYVQRIRPVSPPEVVWRIESLDFSTTPNGEKYCPPNCDLRWVHEFSIVRDDPIGQVVTLVMAEGAGERIIEATLDYRGGNTEAQVNSVLGDENPDWPWPRLAKSPGNREGPPMRAGPDAPIVAPNGVQYIADEPGGPYLLTTFYTTVALPYGASNLAMWRWNGADWRLAWLFPESGAGLLPFLNTPHMGKVQKDPVTGKTWIAYSHSSATSEDWSEGPRKRHGGSWARLAPGRTLGDRPRYLFDAINTATNDEERSHYPRDFDILDDGSWLLMDSSCEEYWACAYESRLFHTQPLDRLPRDWRKEGFYSRDLSHLNLVTIPKESVLEEIRCGFQVLFEAEWVPASRLGATLGRAFESQIVATCPQD